jgi:HPt (histidine-containing phosphotransfer) domain-containing protein
MEAFNSVNVESKGYERPVDRPAAWSAAKSAVNAVLDLKHLRTYTIGEAAFEREILGLYSAELPKYLAALDAANTAKEWHMAAHTIKGASLAVGANRLAQAARSAELLMAPGHPGPSAAIDTVKVAMAEVEAEIARLLKV